MTKLLDRVNETRKKRNKVSHEMLQLPIWEFLMECYDNCTSQKYGEVFTKKIKLDSKGDISELSQKLGRGDLHVDYKKFFECKISFKNLNGKYSITNIRSWENFDYFILCFVDIEDNFKLRFFCVPQKAITENPRIHLTGMNNQSELNSYNLYVGMRTTVAPENIDWLFKEHNMLKGSSYRNLLSFIKSNKS